MLAFILLIAQAKDLPKDLPINPAEPLKGWASLIFQGGAFGFLVYVITVMAPRIMKESKEERLTRERESRAEHKRRDDLFLRALENLNDRFEHRTMSIVRALEDQTADLSGVLKTVCRAGQPTRAPDPPRRQQRPTDPEMDAIG